MIEQKTLAQVLNDVKNLAIFQPSSLSSVVPKKLTPYEEAYHCFVNARDRMPEWAAYEEARRVWHEVGDVKSQQVWADASRTYHLACSILPEWQAYFAMVKQRSREGWNNSTCST